MKNRVCSFLIATFSCLILLAACADVDPEEVAFKVIGYGINFTGTYIVDSGDTIELEGDLIGSDVYTSEKTVEVEDQLEIEARPDSSGDALSSLEIKIYRDGSLIKTKLGTGENIGVVRLIYTSGEAAETE